MLSYFFISYGTYLICWFGVMKKYYNEINKEKYPKSSPWLSSVGWQSQETSSLPRDTLQVVERFRVYVVSWENFYSSRCFWMSVAWCQTSGVHSQIKGCCTSPKPVRSFVLADNTAQACGVLGWLGSEVSLKAHGTRQMVHCLRHLAGTSGIQIQFQFKFVQVS